MERETDHSIGHVVASSPWLLIKRRGQVHLIRVLPDCIGKDRKDEVALCYKPEGRGFETR
jgi:hypothetical protein